MKLPAVSEPPVSQAQLHFEKPVQNKKPSWRLSGWLRGA
jgi:hypothetical protein